MYLQFLKSKGIKLLFQEAMLNEQESADFQHENIFPFICIFLSYQWSALFMLNTVIRLFYKLRTNNTRSQQTKVESFDASPRSDKL